MKHSTFPNNQGLPQTLFLYGTYREDGTPNFGLFCWFSYQWNNNQLGVMVDIGDDKLTKDRILKTGEFSANLVTESILSISDYLGTIPGTDPEKMKIPFEFENGQKLNVPIFSASPVSYELKVSKHIPMNGSDVFLCDIVNTLQDECIIQAKSPQERHEVIKQIGPVCTTFTSYYSFDGRYLGEWHELAKNIK